MSDLVLEQEEAAAPVKKRSYRPQGYAALPGSGPAGETCHGCKNCERLVFRWESFFKCAVIRHRWTRSVKTDIKRSSPACELFVKKEVTNGGGLTCDGR